MLKPLLTGAACLVCLSGCATIVSGSTQSIKIDSNPSGALVYVADVKTPGQRSQIGVTPAKVSVKTTGIIITVEKEGYSSTTVSLHQKMNPWVWGDIALTSPLSTSIDTSTGASKEYDPTEYNVELVPTSMPEQK